RDYATVIIATPDMQGRLVGRRVPAARFPAVIDQGVDICTCVFGWDLTQSLDLIGADVLPLTGMHNGIPDCTLRPDLETLRPAGWLDGVAVCLADPFHPGTTTPVAVAPRVILRN